MIDQPFVRRTLLAGTRVALVEEVFAEVGTAAQYLLYLLDAPRTTAHGLTALREQLADFLDADRLTLMPVEVEVEDVAHDDRFGGVDFEALFLAAPAAAHLGRHGLEAERRQRAAEESLPDVLAHGTVRMLGILAALVFVKQVDDAAHHFAAGVVAGRLRDGGDLDVVALELLFVDAELDAIAEEARQAVNDDRVESGGLLQRVADHLLEYRALVVSRRGTRFDVLAQNDMPVGLAPFLKLAQLVGYRQVVVGLPGGRYAGVEGDTHDSFSVVPAPLSPLGGSLAPNTRASRSGFVRCAQP